MRQKWSAMKELILGNEHHDVFLSLINEEGRIICANANMVKKLHLSNPRQVAANLFDLLHPVHITDFKNAIRTSTENGSPCDIELYLKNGYYHPMKWQINYLYNDEKNTSNYLCMGHRILDEERVKQFNQLGEKNYQQIMEGLNAGIFFQDRRGELIAANQKAAEIFGTTLERLYQLKGIANLWDTNWDIKTESGNQVLFNSTPFMLAIHTATAQTQVMVIRFRNGEERWLRFASQPLFEGNGYVPFAVASNITDITEERALSGLLKDREALFNMFMKQTPGLAWVVDEDANLIFASRAFYQYFGLDEEKSINKKITDLIPSDVAGALYEKHIQVLQTGMPVELLEKVKWANGTDFVFHINIFPIEGVTSKRMLGGHAVNLADKFAAEKQLKEANERLLLLTRATSDAIWEWDMQEGTIFRNDALMDMIGYQAEQAKGLSWWFRRIHPEDRSRVSNKVKEITEKGLHSWEDEYRFKCAGGSYKHMHDRGYVVYESGLPVKMIGSLQDISQLKILEDQLMEEKLHRQKEISETIIRVQEKERTRIGHELHDNVNQILSSTRLFVDMLAPAGEEEKLIKEKSLSYISMAIEEIRKLSRELVVPQLKENGLIESIKALVADIHFSEVIKIEFRVDKETEQLSPGKKVTLYRIIQEQFKNILKYSQSKEAALSLICSQEEVILKIEDKGIGFDSTQTRRGIGLSNIFERTRFYNGEAEIKTSPGNGCTLIVSIPLLD